MMISGALQLDQVLQAVVAVDDPAVEVVQVGGRETAAIERHQRTQVRRDDRNDRRGSSTPDGRLRFHETLRELQTLDELLALCFEPVSSFLLEKLHQFDSGRWPTAGLAAPRHRCMASKASSP
jgi:hypothetical protein